MTRPIGLLAALLCATLLASACSKDDPKPNFSSVPTTPTTSTSPSPTDSPSPTGFPTTGPNVSPGEIAPTEPSSTKENNSTGALGFVTYYIRTLDWVYATSRPDLLTPFYAASCTTCRDGQSAIEQFVASGVIKGGRIAVKQIALVQNDKRGGATFAVSANYSVSAAAVVTAGGATATSFPPGNDVTLTEWIAWQGGRWVIVEERYA